MRNIIKMMAVMGGKYPAGLGPEFILNGDMEAGSPPNGWTAWVDSPVITTAADERPGGTGTKSMDLAVSSGKSGATVNQVIVLTVGKIYQLTFWYKNFDSAGLQMQIYYDSFNLLTNITGLISTSWTKYSYQFTCAEAGIRLLPLVVGTVGQHGRFDDISVKEVIINKTLTFLGGSITAGAAATSEAKRYANLVMEYLGTYKPNGYVWNNAGVGGTGSWWALFRLAADVIAKAPDVVTLDWSVNDFDRLSSKCAAEACIRRIRTALPNVRLCAIHFLDVAGSPGTDPTNILIAVKNNCIALFAHYGIPTVDFDAGISALVAGGASLGDYLNDNVHPKDLGHAYAATLLDPLVASLLGAGGMGALPTRLYDNGDYENTPILRNGTDNDGETGTGWSTVGSTSRQSSTANDTIKWSGTFQSFGLDGSNGAGAGTIAYKVDGGAYQSNIDLSTSALAYLQPIWDGSTFRGAHTITIKVVSGTVKINRFLAV